jgi:hypothetical protein
MQKIGLNVVPLRGANPDWVRDELILTLNLYLQHRSNPPGKTSKEIRELSETLRRLACRSRCGALVAFQS